MLVRHKATHYLLRQLTEYLWELIQEVVLIYSPLLPDRQNPAQLFLTALLAISKQEETHCKSHCDVQRPNNSHFAIYPKPPMLESYLDSLKENWPVHVFESVDNNRSKVLGEFWPFFLAILDHIIGQVKEGQLAWHLSCQCLNRHLNMLLWSTLMWFAKTNMGFKEQVLHSKWDSWLSINLFPMHQNHM